MKVALLKYTMDYGVMLGGNITTKKNEHLLNQIKNVALKNQELSKKLLGQLRFEFDISNSDNPISTFIEPVLFFNFPINKNQYAVFKTSDLTFNFYLTFPVIVPNFFETKEELNDYIYEDGIVHSCYIYSDIFRSEEWNIDLDNGFDLYAIKLSNRIYNKIPRSVQNFYSNPELQFEY